MIFEAIKHHVHGSLIRIVETCAGRIVSNSRDHQSQIQKIREFKQKEVPCFSEKTILGLYVGEIDGYSLGLLLGCVDETVGWSLCTKKKLTFCSPNL